MENLFDLFDISDIPKEIGDIKNDETYNEIIELFKIANRELSIDELTVAHYRKYTKDSDCREPKTKTQIMNKVYKMSKEHNSPIESVKGRKGVYKLKNTYLNDDIITNK